jgi:predicted ATP-dependent serine protease
MPITKQLVYIGDFFAEAQKLKATYGRTELYTTGDETLDGYLGGGFGRPDGYEIVLLYGPSGVGKSTIALNLMAPAMQACKKVGLLVLEDDMADVSVRLEQILKPEEYRAINHNNLVRCLPADALTNSWKLDDLLKYIESWFVDEGVELILLDHLQFAFESAESIKGENEYIAQRVFMQKLNQLMKRVKKTIILVSHVNKATGAKGMDKIVGSGAIAQAATKVIEVTEDKGEFMISLQLRKSRFTAKPKFSLPMAMQDGKLKRPLDLEDE